MLDFLKHIFAFDPNSPLLFTQFYFWAFFAIVYALFSIFQSKKLLRNSYLLFVSLFFYYKTSGLAVLILLFITLSDFIIAKQIARNSVDWKRKIWLILSVTIDLGLLAYFKYAYFFTNLINDLFSTQFQVVDIFSMIGNELTQSNRFNVDAIVLPVGISFYIFQVISYTADVYHRRIEPVKNILDFGFYVSFFPQLVAGPIVRASEFIPQIYKPFHLSRRQFGLAVFWILNGLIKKIILSDYIAVNFIDRVFDNPLLYSGFENTMALIAYSMQVYADFSGYTDIAIGVAMTMGFYLPQNFDSPYKAKNPQEFWRRWHMSLSRWLKTYLYIPLGGNRNASFGTYFWIVTISAIALILSKSWWAFGITISIGLVVTIVGYYVPERRKKIYANLNSFITMLLGGLWHGASWNFMIWGGLNGIGMIINKLWRDMNWNFRSISLLIISIILLYIKLTNPTPIINLAFWWVIVITATTLIRTGFDKLCKSNLPIKDSTFTNRLSDIWAVTQTFIFISFTRLFFRSSSNLDPATANQEAWETATNMINQIGTKWNIAIIPEICWEYRNIFLLVIIGLIIHWLPTNFKRRYRIAFTRIPLPIMALIVCIVVFFIYQFITADLQPFIYFQF
ncbi:MAG: MBOAT family protein [Paludibacteraceae bacterium]|nr:MBOAT family protein [Paludibacteraceae bacterium]